MSKSNGLDSTDFNLAVKLYIECRDNIKKAEKEYKEKIAQWQTDMGKLESLLMQVMDSAGAQMVRTNKGTVSSLVRETAKLEDPDAFMDYVITNNMFDLMNRSANATACREYAEAQGGVLPPGVKLNRQRYISIREAPGGIII